MNTRSPFQAIRSIDYTVIFVPDMTAMRRFYEDVLGFRLLREKLTKIADQISGLVPEQRKSPIQKQKRVLIWALGRICQGAAQEDLESYAAALALELEEKDLQAIRQFDRFWQPFIARCRSTDSCSSL